MQTEQYILDEGLDPEDMTPQASDFASTGQRFANYVIDTIICLVLMIVALVLAVVNGDQDVEMLLLSPWRFGFYGITALYYTILEGSLGKTVGKMVTRTQVVNELGQKPDIRSIFLRSLSRLVPFEAFSAFSGSGLMWHDSWTKTYVVKNK